MTLGGGVHPRGTRRSALSGGRPRRRMAAFVTVVCVATSCANGTTQEGEQRSHLMGTASTSLTLDGEPWWPVGLNAYQLGTDWRVNAGCGA